MSSPTLLVLAAGMGSRYGGLKQIDPIGPSGETIIDYSIYDAMRAGFGKVVFVIRRDIEQTFREIVGSKFEKRLPVEYAFQELDKIPTGFTVPPGRTKPWGTGHATLVAEPVIHEPFAMINADDFYGSESFRVLGQQLLQTRHDSNTYSMVGFTLRKTLSEHGTVARGVCQVDETGLLKQIVEMLKIEKVGRGARQGDQTLTGDEPVSMNFWGFTPTLFGHLRVELEKFLKAHGKEEKSEMLIPTVVNTLVNDGTLQVDQFVMTNACAQFVRTGGTLIYGSAVLVTNLDADGDGMANGWEQAYGLDPLNGADASADNDGDGFTNLQEFQTGTNPTSSASVFRILSVVPTNDDMLVSWTAGGGRTNVVQSATDLTGSYTNVSPNIILPGSGDVTTNYLHAGGATNASSQFYRIRLVP